MSTELPVAKRVNAVTLTMSKSTYDTIMETLTMDSQSASFDKELRDEISTALGRIREIPKSKIIMVK